MMLSFRFGHLSGIIIVMMLAAGGSVIAQDAELAAARDLYASAAYEDALTVLNRLRSSDHPAAQARAIEQYRAFCLLALGRSADAELAIEAVVVAEPSYHPSNTDVSPRVRSAFTDVRRRMLPGIIQQKYAQSKAAFDKKEFATAADGFKQVLAALADPDVASEAGQPPLSDLRTLAGGFEELSAKAAAPQPLPAVAPAPIAAAAPAPRPAPPRVYGGDDPGVEAPITVNQALPMYPGQVTMPRTGKLEIVINESGLVESAAMTGSISAAYDTLALNAVRTWRYKPATMNGVPVKFRKVVQIAIRPTS
jgi:TonB family protein